MRIVPVVLTGLATLTVGCGSPSSLPFKESVSTTTAVASTKTQHVEKVIDNANLSKPGNDDADNDNLWQLDDNHHLW